MRTGALDALADAVGAVGLGLTRPAGANAHVDAVLVSPAGGRVEVALERLSLASADTLARRLDEWNRRLAGRDVAGVVVAERVTGEARHVLNEAGWGWLDLRGHLHLVAPGVFVDADVPALREAAERIAPLAGRVGMEVAAQVLAEPDAPATVRGVARQLGRAPSSVSAVLAAMRVAGLVDDDRRPVVPELFWALAERWQPSGVDIARLPEPGDGAVHDALRTGLADVADHTGWALTDTLAAATYGAPVGVRADHPPDFYVPDDATLHRAVRLLGSVPEPAGRAATVRVAPVPAVCARRVDATGWSNQPWPLAAPLFVALDLARDPGRGREILGRWTPGKPWQRVW